MDNKEIENLEPVEQTAPNNQFNTSNEVTNVQQQSQIQQQIPQQPNNAVSNVTQNNNAAIPSTTVPTLENANSINQEMKNTTPETGMSNEFVEKKGINKKILILICAIAMVLLIGIGSELYFSDSMVLFKSVLNRGYNDISELLDTIEKNQFEYETNENIVIDGSANLTSNYEELAQYTGYNYKFNMGLNLKDQKLGLGLYLLKDNNTVVDGIFYILQNMMYIKSDKVYEKVLYSNLGINLFATMDTEQMKNTYNYDDIDKIVQKMTIYIGNAFNRDDFTKEKSKLTVNNEEIDVVKHTYVIDKEAMYNITSSILTQIKEDEEFIKLITKISGLEESRIKESLNETTVSKDDYEYFDTIKLNIYTKGLFGTFVGAGMNQEGMNLTFTETKEQSEFKLTEDDIVISAVTKDDTTNGSMKSAGQEVIKFTLKQEETEKQSKYDLNVSVPLYSVTLNTNLETNRISNKKVENTIKVNFNMGVGEQATTVGANLTYNVEVGGKLLEVPTADAVDADNLPEEEQLKIITNLQNAFIGTPFEMLFAEEPEEDYYYDDYYGDDEYYQNDSYITQYRLQDLVDLLTPEVNQ